MKKKMPFAPPTPQHGGPSEVSAGRAATTDRIVRPPTPPSTNDGRGDVLTAKLTKAYGCKTIETALCLVNQIAALDHPSMSMDPGRLAELRVTAMAQVGELQPASAIEAMLATQMVGTHKGAMLFLANATKPEADASVRDRNVVRATRLMSLFTEQLEAMAKLKGKGTHQRVVVEHVHVAAGGQAIVGAVNQGKAGGGKNR